ncbi:MAG: hypothetical protein ACSHYB_02730 [Roseibacillus sp.]
MPIEAGPPDLPKGLIYHARLSALEKERTYRIRAGQFSIIEEEGRQKQTFPLFDFVELRLRFQPTRMQPHRYECLLKTKTGRTIKIGNEFYQGLADFRDQSEKYRTFIHHLVREVGYHAPSCQQVTGCSNTLWWSYLFMLLIVFGGLLALLVFFAFSAPPVAIAKLIIIAFMVPVAIKWFKKNKRQHFDATSIPSQVLPK